MRLLQPLIYSWLLLLSHAFACYANTPVSIQLPWHHQFEFAGFYAAIEQGYYRDAGFDVSLIEIDQETDQISQVIQGNADFGVFSSELVHARMEGAPLVFLASYFKRSPLVLVTNKDIRLPNELKGKRIMATKDQIRAAPFIQMFAHFGVDPSKIERVPHDFTLESFRKGEVDAVFAYLTNEIYQLRQQQIPYNVIDPNNYTMEFDDLILFTVKDRFSAQQLRAFRDATTRGWAYALDNTEAIIQLIKQKYNSQNKTLDALRFEAKEMKRIILPGIYALGAMDPHRMHRMQSLLIEQGHASQYVPPEEYLFDYQDQNATTLSREEQAFIQQHPVLTFGFVTSPPFEYTLGRTPKGYNIELMQELARAIGMETRFIPLSEDKKWQALRQQEVDLISTGKRESMDSDRYSYTSSLAPLQDVLISRVNDESLYSFRDLANKRFAMIKNQWTLAQLAQLFPFPFQAQSFNNKEAALNAVSQHQADFFVDSYPSAQYLLNKYQYQNLKITGRAYGFSDAETLYTLNFAFLSSRPQLKSILQKGLSRLSQNQLFSLQKKWGLLEGADTGAALTSEEIAFLNRHPVIRVSNQVDWPPLDYQKNNRATGYSIEFMRLLEQEIPGLNFSFTSDNWPRLLDLARQKKIDVLHGASVTPERQAFLAFTQAYYSTPIVFVVRKDTPEINRISELRHQTIAVEKNTSYINTLLNANIPKAQLIMVDSVLEGLHLVEQRKADAFIDTMATSSWLIEKQQMHALKITPNTGLSELADSQLHIGIRNDWPILKSILEKAMTRLSPAALNTLNQRWFGRYSDNRPRPLLLTPAQEAYLKQKQSLKICIDPGWMPYESLSAEGEYQGMSADYMALLSKKLNLPIQVHKTHTWNQSLEAVRARDCDFLPLAKKTASREAFLNFTEPYLSFPFVIATRVDRRFIENISEVLDKTFTAIKGYAVIEDLKLAYPNIKIIEVTSMERAIEMVQNNQVYGYIDASAAISYHVQSEYIVDIKIAGKLPQSFDLSLASRNDEAELTHILQLALNTITHSEHQQIYNKWVALKIEDSLNYTLLWRIAVGVALVITLILFWNRKLRQEIEQRIAIEQQLRDAQQQALRANRAKGEFLANMSHELRTPMNAVIGMNALALKHMAKQDPGAEYVEKSVQAAKMLLGILNDILDFSKIEAGKLDINSRPMSLVDSLSLIRDLFADSAISKGLVFNLDYDPQQIEYVMGDALRLNQVLTNLVGNAIKFTESGYVNLKLTLSHEAQCHVNICVEDSGKGIDQARQSKIFDAFSQEDTSISREFGGTGLGLSISKTLIQLMKGSISLQSQLGKGSRFDVSLPLDYVSSSEAASYCRPLKSKHFYLTLEIQDAWLKQSVTDILKPWPHHTREPHTPAPYLLICDKPQSSSASPTLMITPSSGNLKLTLGKVSRWVTRAHLEYALIDLLLVWFSHNDARISSNQAHHKVLVNRILLVEDNPMNQQVALNFLTDMCREISLAENGQVALEQIQAHPADYFSLVLMDIHMPVLDGYQATQQIRKNADYDDLPIIAMTANVMPDDIQRCFDAGMQDHISKPFEVSVLRHKVMHWCVNSASSEDDTTFESTPVLDFDSALARLMGEKDLYLSMLNYVLETQIPELKAILKKCEAGELDKEQLVLSLHTIKGSTLGVGAHRMANTLQALESQVKQGKEMGAPQIEDIHTQITLFKQHAESLLQKLCP